MQVYASLLAALVVFGTPPRFDALATEIVRAMRAHASTMGARRATGPLWIDAASFQAAGDAFGDSAFNSRKLVRQLGAGAREGRAAEVTTCGMNARGLEICQVVDNGLLLVVDSVERTEAEVVALVTMRWTGPPRPTGRVGMGFVTLRLAFTPAGGKWRLASSRIYRQS